MVARVAYLYNVEISVMQNGKSVDGGMVRMGIRKAEFRGKDGFWLNGKPYHQLVGGNRHQDFAYVGNAMPNSQQWRDAKRLRKAGMVIVRCAHYPMDPAFMDACDELGCLSSCPLRAGSTGTRIRTLANLFMRTRAT